MEGSYSPSPALDYPEIFSDASRAAEFLVIESSFTNLALFWAKRMLGVLSYVLLPPNTVDNSIWPRISAHPKTERDLFMECLCLCLPRCSKSPGLLQNLVLELNSARVGMGRREVFKYIEYIEVSNILQPFMSMFQLNDFKQRCEASEEQNTVSRYST